MIEFIMKLLGDGDESEAVAVKKLFRNIVAANLIARIIKAWARWLS